MAQYFQAIENLSKPFYAMVVRGLVLSSKKQVVQAKMRKIEFILGGHCLHRFENEKPQLLEAGDALIVPYRTKQIYEAPSAREAGHLLSLIVSFDSAILPFKGEETAPQNNDETLDFLEKYFSLNSYLLQVMDAVLMETLSQIQREGELHLPGFRWRISGLCSSAIVQLARNRKTVEYSARRISRENRGAYLVGCAKEFLMEHLTEDIALDDVASHLQVSREHLSRTFKRVAGQSLFAYFQQIRLEQAKLKLLNSDKNVTEIAAACGFNSSALFCRNFKRYTCMTPLDYRDEFGNAE